MVSVSAAKDKVPLPFVFNIWLAEPSAAGKVYALPIFILPSLTILNFSVATSDTPNRNTKSVLLEVVVKSAVVNAWIEAANKFASLPASSFDAEKSILPKVAPVSISPVVFLIDTIPPVEDSNTEFAKAVAAVNVTPPAAPIVNASAPRAPLLL